SILFFTSPVVVYYANNFLPDTISFAFVLIAWYLFSRYYHSGHLKHLNLSLLFFALAGLLKITSAINVIAIVCIYILNLAGLRNLGLNKDSFHLNLKTILPFLSYFLLIISWYFFAFYYNSTHQATYFSTRMWPIWQLSGETLEWIGDQLRNYWFADYYHLSVFILFLAGFMLILVFHKKTKPFLLTLTLLLFSGVVLFVLLWFYAFGNHDYYIIGLMILPVFILLTVLDMMAQANRYLIRSWIVKVLFSLFVLFNIYYAEKRLDWRYYGWINEYPVFKDLHTVTPYLRSLGIKPEDKVISIPDETACYSLYMMNQKGWTEGFLYNRDSLGIQESISLGARYLVLTGGEAKQRPYLQYFMKNKIGEYNDISIYSLTDY
ncbi:MAG: glycosyltransferase family 39 protein, partial [Bacteroidales bacterium]